MGVCTDPVTKALNERGYNLVKLPRVGIDPMDVLGHGGDSMERLGSITEVWTSSASAPMISDPAPAAGLSGEKTSDLDVGIGLRLLSNVLAGLGGGITLPKLNLAFKAARKVRFQFVNVESTSISPFALGKFLANGVLDLANPFVTQYFGNEATREYIIFDVLKSDSISVTATSEAGTEIGVDVGVLNGALSSSVSATADSNTSTEITFRGSAKASFAFKLFEVSFENGRWIPRGVGATEDLSFAVAAGDASPYGKSVVLAPNRMIRLTD